MKRSLLIAIVLLTACVGASCASTSAKDVDAARPAPKPPKIAISPSLLEDLKITAKFGGITLDQAKQLHLIEVRMDWIRQQLKSRPSGYVLGMEMPLKPDQNAVLYITGNADAPLRDLIEAAGIPVTVREQMKFSTEDLAGRQVIVGRALDRMGFTEFNLFYNLDRAGSISVVARKDDDLPAAIADLTSQQLAARLKKETGIPVKLRLADEPLTVPH